MVGQMKHTVEGGRYADIPIPDFVDIILNGDDEAMYYLLQRRLKPLLYQRYKTYSQHLYDDYEDIVEEFFIYVRESGHTPYQALRRIKKKEAFESWILRTFRNYLNNRSEAESHLSFADEECGNMPFPAEESAMNGKIKIRIVSQLVAYALQVFNPRGRFIFLRSLLTILNKQRAVPNKEMAEALDMSYLSYRVALHHIKKNIKRYKEELLNDESLRLDDKHQELAKRIEDNFSNLYPILFECYTQCIDTLQTIIAVKDLRNHYSEERGFVVHDPLITEPIRVSIVGFWEKLNRWLIV